MMTVKNWTLQTIWAVAPSSANTGWSSFAASNSYVAMMHVFSDGNQNSTISWPLALDAGTYAIDLTHKRSTDRGIYTVLLGGVAAGTIDGYAATDDMVTTLTGIVIPAYLASTVIKFTMATKNASSSNYLGDIGAVTIRRTA